MATGTYLSSVILLLQTNSTMRAVRRTSWDRDSLPGVLRHEAIQLLRGARSGVLQTGRLLHSCRVLLVQVISRRSSILPVDRSDTLICQLVAGEKRRELTPIC